MSSVKNQRLVGAAAELQVAADLLVRGFQVFLNAGDSGPADLVVWDPSTGTMEAIDVKTVNTSYRNSKGELTCQYKDKTAGTDTWIVVVRDQSIHYPEGLGIKLSTNLPQWRGIAIHGPKTPNGFF